MMRRLLAVPCLATQVFLSPLMCVLVFFLTFPFCNKAASKDRKGQTALHAAGIAGSTDAAHLLLQAGAVPDIRDWAGKNAADLSTSEQVFFELFVFFFLIRCVFSSSG